MAEALSLIVNIAQILEWVFDIDFARIVRKIAPVAVDYVIEFILWIFDAYRYMFRKFKRGWSTLRSRSTVRGRRILEPLIDFALLVWLLWTFARLAFWK